MAKTSLQTMKFPTLIGRRKKALNKKALNPKPLNPEPKRVLLGISNYLGPVGTPAPAARDAGGWEVFLFS